MDVKKEIIMEDSSDIVESGLGLSFFAENSLEIGQVKVKMVHTKKLGLTM